MLYNTEIGYKWCDSFLNSAMSDVPVFGWCFPLCTCIYLVVIDHYWLKWLENYFMSCFQWVPFYFCVESCFSVHLSTFSSSRYQFHFDWFWLDHLINLYRYCGSIHCMSSALFWAPCGIALSFCFTFVVVTLCRS